MRAVAKKRWSHRLHFLLKIIFNYIELGLSGEIRGRLNVF